MNRSNKSSTSAPPAQVLIAIGPKDKENLASPDVLHKCKQRLATDVPKSKTKKSFLNNSGNNKKRSRNIEMIKNAINNINEVAPKITSEDLTSATPSEGYWEQLSESRRVALEATLKENAELHSRIMALEYENTRLKSMLTEANNTIKLLTELVDEETDVDSAHGESLVQPDNSSDEDDGDEDVSFASV